MSSSHRADYRLNTRFLGWMLLVIVVLVVGIGVVHYFQTNRLVDRMLTQADLAAKSNEPFKEIAYLEQYVSMKKDNTEARARMGMVLAKNYKSDGQGFKAYYLLQQALTEKPDLPNHTEIRVQSVRLALNPMLPLPARDAIRELDEFLLKAEPENEMYENFYIMALMKANDYDGLEKYLLKLKEKTPVRVEAYARLAWLKRDKGMISAKDAEYILREMFAKDSNQSNPKAWLRAAAYYKYFQSKDYPDDGSPVADLEKRPFTEAVTRAAALVQNNPSIPKETQAEVHFASAELSLARWANTMKMRERAGGDTLPEGTRKPEEDFEEAIGHFKRCLEVLQPLPEVDPLPQTGTVELQQLQLASQAYRMISKAHTEAGRYADSEKYSREQVAKFSEKASILFLPMQLELLDVLVRQNKFEEAEAICQKFASRGMALTQVELQRGHMAFRQQQWVTAARHYERCITEFASNKDYARPIRRDLVRCLKQTGQYDLAITRLREALPENLLSPDWLPTKMDIAATLAQSGRRKEAIKEYQEILQREDANPPKDPKRRNLQAVAGLVVLLMDERQRVNQDSLADPEVQAYLARLPDGPEKDTLRFRSGSVQQNAGAARTEIEKALERDPKVVRNYQLLFDLEMRDRQLEGARAVLKRSEAKLGDTVEVRQMKASIIAASGKDPTRMNELKALAEGLDKMSPDQRKMLLQVLAHVARNFEEYDLAEGWLKRIIADGNTQDLIIYQHLFNVALLRGDEAKIDATLLDIERITNGKENPSYKEAQAFMLINKADHRRDNPTEREGFLKQASDLLASLKDRNDSGRIQHARARVNDLLNRRSEAMDSYLKAINLGELTPQVVARYIELCFTERKSDEVYNLLVKKPEVRGMLGTEIEKVINLLQSSQKKESLDLALEIAKRAVPDDSTDAKKLFWLARVQNNCKDTAGSEATLRRASQYAHTDGNLWLAYVQIMAKNNKITEAKQYVDATHAKLTFADASLFVAQGWALVGELPRAKDLFVKALAAKPDDQAVLMTSAEFYFMSLDVNAARPLLERIIRDGRFAPPQRERAQRMLALCTVATRDHISGLRALEILGFKSPDAATVFTKLETLDDLRGRFAVISVIKGRAARVASAAILREIESRLPNKELPQDEQLAYGQILFALGEMSEANRRLQAAANMPVPKSESAREATARAIYASFLLRTDSLADASVQIKALTALEPDTQRTAELSARLAIQQKKPQEAVAVMKKYGASKDGKPEIAAGMLDALGLSNEAAPLFQQAATSDRVEARLLNAVFQARTGKVAESLAEFDRLWDSTPKEQTVPLLCLAMMSADLKDLPAVVSKAQDRLTDAAKDAKYIPYLAAFKTMVGQEADAVAMMREVLAKNDKDVFTLNNLAFVLAVRDRNYPEALSTIRKVIELVGPQPVYLDTEALILTLQGSHADAVEKLSEALVDAPSATAYIHRAQAYMGLNRKNEALKDLESAKRLNLRLSDFHPLERPAITALLGKLSG